MLRDVPDGHGGKRVSAAAEATADLEITALADATLQALVNDPATPAPLKSAVKAELRSRGAGNDAALGDEEAEVGAAIVASHRRRSGIVANMERLAKARRGGVNGFV